MALPLAPVAGIALRYGAVALAAYAVSRSRHKTHYDQRAQDAMDDVNEGVGLRSEPGQTDGTVRYRRAVRLGQSGPGLEFDITALGRIRIRKL